MNLEESNEFLKAQNSKKKKKNIILGLIVICIIFVVLLIVAIYVLKIKDANTSKLFINGNKINLSKTLFVTQDDVTYVSAKEIASIIGYNYVQGEYKQYTQDEDYCYLQSDYEIISIAADSSKIKKYLINTTEETEESATTEQIPQTNEQTLPTFVVKSANDTMELFELSTNTISIENNIYVPVENIEKIFNVSFNVEGKSIYIENIYALYQRGITAASQLGLEMSTTYENVRAMADDMLVAKDSKNQYGVISMKDGNKILDMKYTDIQYIQNTDEFFVYTDTTVGLLDKEGNTIITPTKYDSLAVFDEINKLYLAEDDGDFGILNREGKVVVAVSYDAVGIKALESYEEFEIKDSETPNLLDSKYIIVLEKDKVGLYDTDGNRIIKSIYNSFGYVQDEEDKKSDLSSVLTIPKEYGVYGLVIEQNGFYGIFDLESDDIVIPCSLSKIYSKTESGELNYYMETENEVYNVKEVFEEYDNASQDENEPEENKSEELQQEDEYNQEEDQTGEENQYDEEMRYDEEMQDDEENQPEENQAEYNEQEEYNEDQTEEEIY